MDEFAAIRETFKPSRFAPEEIRNYALFLTWATCGVSTLELVNAKITDFDVVEDNNRTIHVLQVPIAGNEDAKVAVEILDETYNAIQDWLEFRPIDSDYIFSRMEDNGKQRGYVLQADGMSVKEVIDMLKKHFEMAGISYSYKENT